MMGSLNEIIVQKKLESLQPTQENIETVSLWCLHHKDYHSMIVSVWIKCYKTVTLKQRLSLIYLANDVCQRERQKKFDGFRKSFAVVLKEAVTIVRSDEIRPNVERIVDIWKEREIFDNTFVNELKLILQTPNAMANNDKNQPVTMVNEKWLAEFKLDALIAELERQKQEKQALQRAQSLLPSVPFTSDGSVKSYLKDRQEGLKYMKEIDLAHKKLSDFVNDLERQLQGQSKLIGLLEQAKIFYETQLSEASIVETAYRKFGSGIQLVKEELDKMKASGLFPPNDSPPNDAPSPSPNDDPFALGVEAVVATKGKTKNVDRHEPEDMELDDEGPTTSRMAKSHETTVEGLKVATNRSFMTSNGKVPVDASALNFSSTKLSDIPIPPPSALSGSFYHPANHPRPPPQHGTTAAPQQINQQQQPQTFFNAAQPRLNAPRPTYVTFEQQQQTTAGVVKNVPQQLQHAGGIRTIMTYNYDHTKLAQPPIPFDYLSSPPPGLPSQRPPSFNFNSVVVQPQQNSTTTSELTADVVVKDFAPSPAARGINQRNLTVLSGGGNDEIRFRNRFPSVPSPQESSLSPSSANNSMVQRGAGQPLLRSPGINKTGWPQQQMPMSSPQRFPPPQAFHHQDPQRFRQPSWQQGMR